MAQGTFNAMKTGVLALAVALPVAWGPSVAHADEDAAWAAFSQKDFRAAYKEFLPIAASGEPYGQFVLGWMFATGSGVTQDAEIAAKWYRAAAEQGVVGAQFNLALLLDTGDGNVTQDLSQAVRWYRLAANQGDVAAQYNLANMQLKGEGAEKNIDAGMTLLMQAADGGDARAMGHLGVLRLDSKVPGADGAEAWKYLDAAAKLGNKSAGLIAVVLDGQLKADEKKYAQALQTYWSAENGLTLPSRR